MTTPAEQPVPYALTSVSRVKDMINNPDQKYDMLLTRLINSATDFIEQECSGRRFAMTFYSNETGSTYGSRQKYQTLRQSPVFYLQLTGDTTANSPTISNVSAYDVFGSGSGSGITGIQPGMIVRDVPNFPQGINITVVSVNTSANTITLSANASITGTGMPFQVNGLTSAQYRAGTPSAPSWTNFVLDQYELINNGQSGIVRVYGVIPRLYNNMIRFSYWAGYLIDFKNFGNRAYHTLPADLTYTCEKLVIRWYSRRMFAGKVSENLSGTQVNWKDALDAEDKQIIEHYKRVPAFF